MTFEAEILQGNLKKAIFMSPLFTMGFSFLFFLLMSLVLTKDWISPETPAFFSKVSLGIGVLGYVIGLAGSVIVGLPLYGFLERKNKQTSGPYILAGLIAGPIIFNLGFYLAFLILGLIEGKFELLSFRFLTFFTIPMAMMFAIFGALQSLVFWKILSRGAFYAD